MKSFFPLLAFILILQFFSSCQKEEDVFLDDNISYDIILVAGQSNTCSGAPFDPVLDQPDTLIKQLGRFGANNLKVIEAVEPLQHHSLSPGKIGFGLTFAKNYVNNGLLEEGRYLLIIPCGNNGTGFSDKRWNKGNDLYNDAVFRTKYVLGGNPQNRVIAILWHQGEQDVDWTDSAQYVSYLSMMISNMRKDISGNPEGIPFILGGMVPFWVEQEHRRIQQQRIIATTPSRLENTGYASPYLPFSLHKLNDWDDMIHYNAEQQRELGKRYFSAYLDLSN